MVTLTVLQLCASMAKPLAFPQGALSLLQRPEDRAQGEEAMCLRTHSGALTQIWGI